MEKNSIEVYMEKCNHQLFTVEHHIKSKVNSKVNFK